MKKIFKRFREKISFKEPPPPYRENDVDDNRDVPEPEHYTHLNGPACEVVDLLANCKLANADDQESEIEYAEIEEMGLWHSTPLSHRHKSKISLTWVLKENLENTKLPDNFQTQERKKMINAVRHHQSSQAVNEIERQRKCKSKDVKDRVVGRNEYYNLRFKSACEAFVNGHDTWSDDTSATGEYTRKKHRHRHRRKTRNQAKFGYDIRDLDSFLSEASMNRPGNIPVVVAYPTTLYQTHKDCQRELTLPLGTVVNAVFKNQQWLYAQTPHGDEGYVLYNACLPLGILPNRTSPLRKTPCWESSTDIYPRPCGNLTDTEKENLRGRTRSECRYRPRNQRKYCAEKDFDTLYLKTKSVCSNIDRPNEKYKQVKRQTLVVVNSDYNGSVLNKTMSVHKGDVVVLMQAGSEHRVASVDTDWFYVRKRDGSQGFIPASIAGHGYI